MTEKTITLNLQSKSLLRKVYAVQADSGRTLRCVISDCTLPAGLTARIYAKKPDDTEVYNAGTIDGNAVVVPLTTQMLAAVGSVHCQIELSKDTEKVTTFYFEIVVEKSLVSDSAIESSNEYTALEKLVTSSEQTITDCEKATTNAKTATTKANNAASSANSAASTANTAASKANTATSAANTAASTANASATKADTAATNADSVYEKLKDMDAVKVESALSKALNATGESTELTMITTGDLEDYAPVNVSDSFLFASGSGVKKVPIWNIPHTSTYSGISASDALYGYHEVSGSGKTSVITSIRYRILDLFNSITLSSLSTTAKTISGAINELFTAKGSTDISDIGDGTLTGAVSELNTNLDNYVRKDKITLNATQQTSGTVLSTIMNSGLQIGAMGARGLSDCPDTTNEWAIFWFGSQSRITVIANKYTGTSTYLRAIYNGAWFNSWSTLH